MKGSRRLLLERMSPVAAILNIDQAPLDAEVFRRFAEESSSAPAQIGVYRCAGLAAAPIAGTTTLASDGCVSVVFDGRLDDRERLVASLCEACPPGQVRDMSDAELLLRAYVRWAGESVTHLLGDFAFCLWDRRTRRLMCARDHFGVKPLYYAHAGNTLIVSSSLRWLRRHPQVSDRLRHEAIGDFLLFGVCQEPSHTVFADISRVPPGHRLCCSLDSGRWDLTRYWKLEPREPIRYRDPQTYVDEFWHLLCEAVADRAGAGPLGVLMSGGLDSSSVTAAAIDALGPAARYRVHAYTIVYDGRMSDQEGRLASLFAAERGIPISQIAADQYHPFDRWESDALPPEPTLEALSAVMLDVLDLASRHGSVVLTGDGGDLLLLPTSLLDQMRHVPLMSLANDVIASLRLGLRPPLGLANRVRQWRTSEGIPGWLSDDLLDRFDPHARWREVRDAKGSMSAARGRAFDVTDPWWTSMFEGLDPSATSRPVEVRYPFFDVRLAEFALRLPSFPWCLDKRVLREATRDKLPHAIRTRPKTPLAESPVLRTGQWSSQRAVELFEHTPAIASFVDARKFSSSVRGDSLLSNESLSAWAAISLARWLNEGQRSKAKVKGASLHRLRVGDSF